MTANRVPGRPARRDDILRTAAELFAESGFHGVGMRAIADAVGIRGSSLYHHFGSKMDILHAISLEATKRFTEAQVPRFHADGSRAERLRTTFCEHILYFWEHRVEVAVGLRDLRELPDDRREEVNKIRRAYQREIVSAIEEGRQTGEFDVEDPYLATMAVLNLINGVNDWFRDGGRLTIDEVARQYAEFAVDGVLQTERGRQRAGDRGPP